MYGTNMTLSDAYRLLEQHIYDNLDGKQASGGWYHIRGDSFCANCASHVRSALYILAKEGTSPALNCFRAGCGERKIMGVNDFYRIGFANDDAIKVILAESSKIARGSVTKYSDDTTLIRKTGLSIYQKSVLRDRCRFTNDELKNAVYKYRLIPNINGLIDDSYTDEKIRNKFDYLRAYSNTGTAVVFATNDYNTFTVRSQRLKGMISVRESVFTGYTLKSSNYKQTDTLIVTEGIFDLLNIKRFYCNVDNGFYVATLGFANMFNMIKRYYCQYINTVKTLILFADSDIQRGNSFTYDVSQYDKLLRKINKEFGSNAFCEIYIVYNSSSKDFGDFREEITPVKIKIK